MMYDFAQFHSLVSSTIYCSPTTRCFQERLVYFTYEILIRVLYHHIWLHRDDRIDIEPFPLGDRLQ